MASLVLGVAGAVVGSFFGAPQVGWMIGSALGAALDPQVTKSEGPRIGDAQITSSTLGTPMMVLYGTSRISGNVIQSSKVREVSKTESQGKGGPSAESTTYSYNADVAIDLCEGEAFGIRKLWKDGKLVYDVSTDGTSSTVIASSIGAVTLTFYPGNETQLPDPTLEALTGVGATPAYRGRCYVVFSQLECPGGRIPQITFEVVREASDASPVALPYATVSRLFSSSGTRAVITEQGAYHYDVSVTSTPLYTVGDGFVLKKRLFDKSLGLVAQSQVVPLHGSISLAIAGGSNGFTVDDDFTLYVFELDTNVRTEIFRSHGPDRIAFGATALAAYDPITENIATTALVGFAIPVDDVVLLPSGTRLNLASVAAPAMYDNIVYMASREGGVTYINTYSGADGSLLDQWPAPNNRPAVGYLPFVSENGVYLCQFSSNNIFVGDNSLNFYKRVGSGWLDLVINAPYDSGNAEMRTFWCNDHYAIVGPTAGGQIDTEVAYFVIPFQQLDGNPVPLVDIITDQCRRSGISADKLSFIGVDDEVSGYPVTRVSSGRANIQPLQTAYFVDAAEVDLKLVFTKRASAPVSALIPYEELAASEDGSAAGDPFPLVRAQEEEFPRSVTTSFIDINSDYQPGAESSRREVTKSINDVSSAIPICTNSDHAKQVAEVLLFDAWNGRNKRSGTLTRKYAYLTPGDVVPIEYPAGTIQQWILTRVSDTGLLIEFEAVEANAALYQVTPPGSMGSSGQILQPLPVPTQVEVLDVPLLRDADNDAGVYVAMGGVGANWRGAALYVGKDEATLVAQGSVSTSASMGAAEDVLGDWTSTMVDEAHTLTVSMGPHTLDSTTREEMLSGGVNVFAYGAPGRWEIGQFIRAVSLGDGRYTLSGFLRGLRGTEVNRGLHQENDVFVLLVARGMLRPDFDVSELGQERLYRGVSTGRDLASASSVTAVNTGAGLKPLSAVNLRSTRQDNGDIRFTWDRRTRFSSNWLAGVMPLGESSEAYEVDIVIGEVVKRTLSASTAQADYVLPDQYGDAGEAVTAVTARVYQMSALVGRGFGSQFSSAVAPQAGGSTFPGSSSVNLSPVAAAGSALIATSVAKYGDNTAYKVFESYDQGVTFTQLDGLGAPVSNIPNATVALADGTYISFEYEKLNDPAQTDFYLTRGAQGSAPVVTTTKFTRPYAPLSMGTDGSKFVVMTYGNRVYTSTDGIAFTLQGIATLPNSFVAGNGLGNGFVWAAGRWFIVPPGGRDLYYTTDVNAVTGWTACALPVGSGGVDFYLPQYYRMAERAGVLFISALRNTVNGSVSAIFKSTDSGSTWTVSLYPAVGGFSDVWNLGGRLVAVSYDFMGKSNISDDGGVTWSAPSNGLAFVDHTYAVQIGATLVVAAGRAFIAPGDPPQELRYTTDGVTFTNSAGV